MGVWGFWRWQPPFHSYPMRDQKLFPARAVVAAAASDALRVCSCYQPLDFASMIQDKQVRSVMDSPPVFSICLNIPYKLSTFVQHVGTAICHSRQYFSTLQVPERNWRGVDRWATPQIGENQRVMNEHPTRNMFLYQTSRTSKCRKISGFLEEVACRSKVVQNQAPVAPKPSHSNSLNPKRAGFGPVRGHLLQYTW